MKRLREAEASIVEKMARWEEQREQVARRVTATVTVTVTARLKGRGHGHG